MTTAKKKNPLYVVKGKDVEEAKGMVDMMIKKLGLGPVLESLKELLQMLMSMVNSYPMLVEVQKIFDLVMARLELFKKYSFA